MALVCTQDDDHELQLCFWQCILLKVYGTEKGNTDVLCIASCYASPAFPHIKRSACAVWNVFPQLIKTLIDPYTTPIHTDKEALQTGEWFT